MRLLTGGSDLDNTLATLIERYDNVEFAVAWAGTGTQTYAALLAHLPKIRRAVIGTHFYQTHPDVLDAFIGSNHVRFILEPKELFHPKAYFFWNSDCWEIIVGSANMTRGGLTSNDELLLHATSEPSLAGIRTDFQRQLLVYWNKARKASTVDAEEYRQLWQRNRPTRHWLACARGRGGRGRKGKVPVQTRIMTMPWQEFLKEVQEDRVHSLDMRCALLEKTTAAFEQYGQFTNMPESFRRLIAGFSTNVDPNWAWFGKMSRARVFYDNICNNNPHISDALDEIPLQGKVTKGHYAAFIAKFSQAFSAGGRGIGVTTRLLAMKRPDYFVCLDSKNQEQLCSDFGIPSSMKDDSQYWDDVVCRILNSVWWNEPEPQLEQEHRVWRGRAAMLDAIFYDPDGTRDRNSVAIQDRGQ